MKVNFVFLIMLIAGMAVFGSAHQPSADISVDVVDSAAVKAGGSVSLVVTVTNNQDFDDTFYVAVSGECLSWAKLSKHSLDVPAGSKGQVVLTISPPYVTSMPECRLNVYVRSDAGNIKWYGDSVNIHVSTDPQTSKTHYQPEVSVDNDDSLSASLSTSGMSTGRLGVDIVLNPKLQTRGYILNDEGKSCVGDIFTVDDTSLVGEWYQKGGPMDTPPIEFVDDLDAVKAQISTGTYKTKTYAGTICSWRMDRERSRGPSRCIVEASMICSYDCEILNNGAIKKLSNNSFEVIEEGPAEVKVECPVDCIFFVDRKESAEGRCGRFCVSRAYGVMKIQSPGTLTSTTVLNAVGGTRGPDLRVIKTTYLPRISEDQPMYVRLLVENAGDMDAIIDSVTLNLPDSDIIYKPKKMFPGEKEEILLKANAKDVSDLKAVFEYRSDKLGCLGTKEFSETFNIGTVNVLSAPSCRESSDCDGFGITTAVCCMGTCRDAAFGTCDDLDGDGHFEWSYY